MKYPKQLEGKKICFLGKGGAGKSTCLILTAKALAESGCQVCVLDSDSTNLGLYRALGIPRAPEPLMNHFGGMVFQGGRITCPVDDPSLLENAHIDLRDLPDRYKMAGHDGIVLLQGGKLADFGVGAGCDGPIVKLSRDLRVTDGGRPVTLLVDFKAGLEDFSRGALVAMDALVAVCDPSMAGIQIAITLQQVLERQRHGDLPATGHLESPDLVELARRLYRESRIDCLHVVLNKVPYPETGAIMRERLEAAGLEVATVLPDTPALRKAWLREEPLSLDPFREEMEQLLRHLAGESTLAAQQ